MSKVAPVRATEGLVSVILPTFNRAGTLPRAIGSVLSQSYRNLELQIGRASCRERV